MQLGGTMRQVQVWFQNRRQRDQKMQADYDAAWAAAGYVSWPGQAAYAVPMTGPPPTPHGHAVTSSYCMPYGQRPMASTMPVGVAQPFHCGGATGRVGTSCATYPNVDVAPSLFPAPGQHQQAQQMQQMLQQEREQQWQLQQRERSSSSSCSSSSSNSIIISSSSCSSSSSIITSSSSCSSSRGAPCLARPP